MNCEHINGLLENKMPLYNLPAKAFGKNVKLRPDKTYLAIRTREEITINGKTSKSNALLLLREVSLATDLIPHNIPMAFELIENGKCWHYTAKIASTDNENIYFKSMSDKYGNEIHEKSHIHRAFIIEAFANDVDRKLFIS